MKKENAIELINISKSYKLYNNKKDRVIEAFHPLKKELHKNFYALKDVSISVPKGEILGIVGANGSGKSTLLKVICGVLSPNSGTVNTKGNIVPLLELGSGFNPEFTGYENIYFYSSLLGHSSEFINKCIDEIIEFADIGDFINQPVKTYSSGMRARLAFSVSVNVDPDILILDEILSVGDELFRKKCFNKMNEFFESGKTILLVTHNCHTVVQLCSSAIFMNKGQIVMSGSPKNVTHYYNKFLFAGPDEKLSIIKTLLSGKQTDFEQNYIENSDDADTQERNPVSEPQGKKRNEVIYEPYYVSGYESQTIRQNRHYDVDILDYHIRTQDGKRINHLVTGREYIISYRVLLNEAFEGLRFGMTVRTEKDIKAIGGIGQPMSSVSKYDDLLIEWSFNCMLNTGVYYVSLSAWADIDGVHRPLNQMLDCIVFKVLEHEFTYFGRDAMVYLDQKCEITRFTKEQK